MMMSKPLMFLIALCVGCAPANLLAQTKAEPKAADGSKTAPGRMEPTVLGAFPLCEASGAKLIACPQKPAAKCVMVADNEKGVFLFEVAADGQLVNQKALPFPGSGDMNDIEAIASQGSEFMLVASHSRNKKCELKKKRRRISGVAFEPGSGSLKSVAPQTADGKDSDWLKKLTQKCSADLIHLATADASAANLASSICDAIAAGETFSDANCPHALNIEGAAVVGARLWVGLRSPLVDGKAALLRVTDGGSLVFDGIATIDLKVASDGKPLGIRDLDVAGDWLYGIAGPEEDTPGAAGEGRFLLWRAPLAEVRNGATIARPAWSTAIPAGSEGLAVDGDHAFVVIDGDGGDDDATSCVVSAHQVRVSLPHP